jgi:hypothetical protein
LEELESKASNEVFEWLNSLENDLKNVLEATPVADIRTRRKLKKKLRRVRDRHKEYSATLQT